MPPDNYSRTSVMLMSPSYTHAIITHIYFMSPAFGPVFLPQCHEPDNHLLKGVVKIIYTMFVLFDLRVNQLVAIPPLAQLVEYFLLVPTRNQTWVSSVWILRSTNWNPH